MNTEIMDTNLQPEQNAEPQAAVVVTSITPAPAQKMSLAAVQAKLAGQTGRRFWKNLEELSATPEFDKLMAEEFPRQAGSAFGVGEFVDSVSRRGFLKVMGASMALAGLAGCTKQPDEPIYAYIKQPEDLVLGRPMYFATAHPFPTGAIPILVKTDAFRPIKIEGNPDHPMSKGKSDAYTQGTLLELYDPDRSKDVRFKGQASGFASFQDALLSFARQNAGQGLYFFSETITSPTLAAQWKQVQAAFPQAKLIQWDPVNQDNSRAASKAAFGSYMDAQYKLEEADIIVSLDADFLGGIAHPGFLPLAAAYAERHRYEEDKPMNRMYVIESMPTVTGFKADHRLALRPSEIPVFAQALASGGAAQIQNPAAASFLAALSKDLKANSGKVVVIPGEGASPAVHLAAYQLNSALGAVGKTVVYGETVNPLPSEQMADLKSLVADAHAGKVQFLVMLGVNPVYNAPADMHFLALINSIPTTAHLGNLLDETGRETTWHINKSHYLESWSDARAYDGQVTIIQPMIAPLYDGKSAHDILQGLLSNPSASAYDAVAANSGSYARGAGSAGAAPSSSASVAPNPPGSNPISRSAGGAASAGALASSGTPDSAPASSTASAIRPNTSTSGTPSLSNASGQMFRKALHDGWVANTAFLPSGKSPSASSGSAQPLVPIAPGTMEIVFKHDPSIYDGRYANVGWLQELPKQVTNLSWDNAALVSIDTMVRLGIAENEAVELELNGRKVIAPVLMVPGHPDDTITVYLGGARTDVGRAGSGVGFNAYTLRTSDAPNAAAGVKLTRGKGTYDLCVTKVHSIEHRGSYAQHDLNMKEYDKEGTFSLGGHEAEERGIIRYATVAEAKADPKFTEHGASGTLVNKVGYGPEGERPDKELTFFPNDWRYDHKDPSTLEIQNKWGMAIDLNSCIGCNACIVSCYAENNIPVVGREQVKVGRDMQWLRIDTYFEGDLHGPKAFFQPMMCQHCENAGCEQVCPVGATVHTPEGINTMVYNRCVGTRYCSNNCPYKVRRFNFLLYSDYDTESLKFMRNPDVTVRSRGVMEKCSYCIQRIEYVKIDADKENRAIKDGEIVTACQQACPTNAIVFGNLNDPSSKVAQQKSKERDYQVLADLNFRPRTTYTAGVINPNPELA